MTTEAPVSKNTFGEDRNWKKGLLEAPFADVGLCLMSFCCPCFRIGQTVERARLGMAFLPVAIVLVLIYLAWDLFGSLAVSEQREHPTEITVAQVLFQLLSWVAFFVAVFLTTYWRTKLRSQYGIEGSAIGDCCTHLWCNCCAVAQEGVEADIREIGAVQGCTCQVWPDGSSTERAPLVAGETV
eukprot:CAMPEP_0175821660 /NCGR_PEP_ID=MMETSP0107_2-20121207/9261_1 /TAXON_ID=195067 ORGANISM="Goniomonas pacifica, Strain CCMP1869" /NCGR_SAMPLE_ID=MMETSP0107_2 /ASSEMBLY_ACC=CAM_ASM_000203 /LENGTH=183 /DNA_ID=CAMNT_0017134069 /DNA_START=123 /DNA_END=674 /DNA_ORIENTATION=+